MNFWTELVDEEMEDRVIRWTDEEYRIFRKIVVNGFKEGLQHRN
jgi:hypothetical protein